MLFIKQKNTFMEVRRLTQGPHLGEFEPMLV